MRRIAYETFNILDLDGSGYMDVPELQVAFDGLGVKLSLAKIAKLVRQVQPDVSKHKDLGVGPEEFLQLLHRNPKLFGSSYSLQMLASAHRRTENLDKLINKPKGKALSEWEFKLPPVTDLPKRRVKSDSVNKPMKGSDQGHQSYRLPKSLVSAFANDKNEEFLVWDDDDDDGFDAKLEGTRTQQYLERFKEKKDAPVVSKIATELRKYGMSCQDDLSPELATIVPKDQDEEDVQPPEGLFDGVRRRWKKVDADEDTRKYGFERNHYDEKGVVFLSGQMRGQRAQLRGTQLTALSPLKVDSIARDPMRSSKLRMQTKPNRSGPLSIKIGTKLA
eukprot:CAMPEP_0173467554 /NCGR_PEP_ID=MMETSP1357-20121228/75251_1 /TAXON_ID=77926 /ORGANISM="Hemiselmis rufescens, Strain PCC563" /LENGTH=332 /DNA_ID=CAMNT_0014435697 /DNA_START=1 /DNA_END=999 /DNA_ORIENTATION=+